MTVCRLKLFFVICAFIFDLKLFSAEREAFVAVKGENFAVERFSLKLLLTFLSAKSILRRFFCSWKRFWHF